MRLQLNTLYLAYTSLGEVYHFSHLKNPYHYPDKESTSIPRIAWGKIVKVGKRYQMSMDIACHHALLDGYPMALAFNKVQHAIDNFEKYIKE